MQLKEVLESESKVLTSSQREEYFHRGYLKLEGFLDGLVDKTEICKHEIY